MIRSFQFRDDPKAFLMLQRLVTTFDLESVSRGGSVENFACKPIVVVLSFLGLLRDTIIYRTIISR